MFICPYFHLFFFIDQTDDLDTFENYDKVWYRFLKYGIPFTLDRESCIVQTATTLNERSREVFVLRIEAYDNEGKNPSHSTDRDFKVELNNWNNVLLFYCFIVFIYFFVDICI